jgi:hypothetical protein
MAMYPDSLDRMLAVWNERDLTRVRAQLEAALAPEIVFIDPTIVTTGLYEFEANVRAFRTKYAHASLVKTSGIDSHHNLHRYTWAISIGSKLMVAGFDVTETNQEGRIVRVLGFFGPLPESAHRSS